MASMNVIEAVVRRKIYVIVKENFTYMDIFGGSSVVI